MKKIILLIFIIIFIPFIIIYFKEDYIHKEIKLEYINNINIRVKRHGSGNIETMNVENYLVGVLAGEMPISMELEALKAQAVASRSYALRKIEANKENEYDVIDTVMNQVYLDEEYLKEKWQDKYITNINKLRKAVSETMDEYLDYNGEVIDALFFSTSNGYTEDSGVVFSQALPYLKSVKSFWDSETSTVFKSSYTMSLSEFYQKLGIPYQDILNTEVLERSSTNRITSIKINDTIFKGTDIYKKLSLRSTDFTISQDNTKVIIDMTGYGHGVGMSQYGAQGMAKEGYTYREILSYYYQDTKIKKITK